MKLKVEKKIPPMEGDTAGYNLAYVLNIEIDKTIDPNFYLLIISLTPDQPRPFNMRQQMCL